MKKRMGESGNIFFTLFGAVALVGGHELLGVVLVVCLLPLISFHAHRRYTFR